MCQGVDCVSKMVLTSNQDVRPTKLNVLLFDDSFCDCQSVFIQLDSVADWFIGLFLDNPKRLESL